MTMENFESKVADLKDDIQFERGFWHEDGSFTAILRDDDPDHANPRDNDGNVASLVTKSRDYRDLDDPDRDIEEARDRWDDGYATACPHSTTGRITFSREHMVSRYLAIFRTDVVAYEDDWQVNGSTQSDFNHGYAYALRSDWNEAFPSFDPATGYVSVGFKTITPADCIAQELDVYGQWFAGEVYGYVHVEPGEIIVTTDVDGEHAECRHCGRAIETDSDGRWVDPEATGDDAVWRETCDENHEDRIAAHEPTRTLKESVYTDGKGNVVARMDEESVWGFLGYDKLEDIAAEATSSPITETVWS